MAWKSVLFFAILLWQIGPPVGFYVDLIRLKKGKIAKLEKNRWIFATF